MPSNDVIAFYVWCLRTLKKKSHENNDNINGGETLHFQTNRRLNIWLANKHLLFYSAILLLLLTLEQRSIIAKTETR
jgi:hypothetical protein